VKLFTDKQIQELSSAFLVYADNEKTLYSRFSLDRLTGGSGRIVFIPNPYPNEMFTRFPSEAIVKTGFSIFPEQDGYVMGFTGEKDQHEEEIKFFDVKRAMTMLFNKLPDPAFVPVLTKKSIQAYGESSPLEIYRVDLECLRSVKTVPDNMLCLSRSKLERLVDKACTEYLIPFENEKISA